MGDYYYYYYYEQECGISVVGNGFAIAAQHRDSGDEDTGFSFVNCTVSGAGEIYLGRAWGNYSRIVYSYTQFDIGVRAGGWEDWRIPSRDKYGSFCYSVNNDMQKCSFVNINSFTCLRFQDRGVW